MSMSFQSRQEYLETKRQQYRQASSREDKAKILDEVENTLDYHRKYLIRILNKPTVVRPKKKQNRSKPLKYQEALPAIELIWQAMDYICAERLHPVLAPTAQRLAQFGELTLTPQIVKQLEEISRPTLGRYLARLNSPKAKRLPDVKPASLKSTIPIDRYEWDESRPGALEIDLVEHNGGDSSGHYAYTLSVVDIVSGYSLRHAILGKAQSVVFGALREILADWPFTPWGLHSDNGPEFLNDQLDRFCRAEKFTFSRSRPYKKNDNAHVEQKNRQYVREMVGYERYDTPEAIVWLNEIYEYVDLYANLILPMRKVVSKERVGKRIKKRFDKARTPFQRLVEAGVMTKETTQRLRDIQAYLNPLEIRRTLDALLVRGPEKQQEKEPVLN